MDIQAFYKWYNSLNLRPESADFFEKCVQTSKCTHCGMRCGCPIRPFFYIDERLFELHLQKTEIKASHNFSKVMPSSIAKQIAFNGTQKLREKRKEERRKHPTYSYI